MIRKLAFATAALLVFSTNAMAEGSLGLSFNDYSAQLNYSQVITDHGNGQSVLGVRGIYNDRKETNLASVTFEVAGPFGNSGVKAGAGVRGYYIDSYSDEVAGGGIGAVIGFSPPAFNKLSFESWIYFCPEIFSALDGEEILEFGIMASLEVAPNASFYVGYTDIEIDLDNGRGEREVDNTVRGGLSLGF